MINTIKLPFFLLSTFFLVACSNQSDQQENAGEVKPVVDPALVAEVYEAADKRIFDKALLGRAIDGDFPYALVLFSLSGTEACTTIRPYLSSTDDAILEAAVTGAGRCGSPHAFEALLAIANDVPKKPSIRIAALKAVGFASDEDDRSQMAASVNALMQAVNEDSGVELAAAAVYGLMQNITYAGLSPSALPELDIQAIMDAAMRDDRLGFEAAYLLMRMQGLRAALDFDDVAAAIEGSTQPEKTYALLRVAGQFGNAASDLLRRYGSVTSIEGDLSTEMFNGAEANSVAAGAIIAMSGLNDGASLTHLFQLLNENNPAIKQLALSVMARRSDADEGVAQRMWHFARGDNPWLAVTAASGLVGFGDPNALYLAEEWLESGSFYQAFQAVGLLSRNPEGRDLLQNYVVTSDDPVRTQLVMATLDPNGVEPRAARETATYADALASTVKRLKLETTRGDIIIEMIEETPYAAHNFITLAAEGKLDGMVWHRVLPGFVAQAGQRDDVGQFAVPTIREEWGAELHAPGTVGVATSGPDTGTTQFFINLMHNRHLDDRYSVFGRVVSGPYGALQEGDIITRATVTP
ncbi:peptidylprolyl isomerase [Kordiimonas aquimaris]|uniref:peptidylprolyl isomerase n=1 Tax=Kordiimonas aquimaris TaxID=707591 RepID=UPI0021D29F55|nr:peptidylprolyl isomerase [Kordiimonas aquimaris]